MGPDQRKPDIERLLQFFPDGRLVLIISAVLGMMAFGYHAFFMATPTFRATTTALLHKSAEGRSSPIPGQTYPATSVTGVPSAEKPFRTATRTWNSAT